MKKILYGLFGLLILALFIGTTGYLYQKSQKPPVIFATISPVIGDLQKVTVASGTIVPRKEIEIKPQVGGIINEIYVQAGEKVQKGTALAKIRIVPNLEKLNEAENRLNKANILYTDTKQEVERQQKMYEQHLISQSEFKKYQSQFQNAQTDLEAARNNLQLVKEGVTKQTAAANNTIVASTVDGTILEIPVKEGATVVETSTFNAGTTIATIADMGALVFEGKIDESEVGKLHEGMELQITIGAIEGKTFKAALEHIAPKGNKEGDGAVQFQIKAAVVQEEGTLIRAGYSANAKIVLARKEQVLTLPESMIRYDKDQKPYVEVEVGVQQFAQKMIELGLSDGINVEIVSGLTVKDKVKNLSPKSDITPNANK